jgi:WD40 repeat protein
MKFLRYIPIILVLFYLVSCTSKEGVIDSGGLTWQVLAATDSVAPALQLIHMPNNTVIISDIFQDINGFKLSAPVKKIVEYDTLYYVFVPDAYKIYVLNANNFMLRATIDYSQEALVPTDICFYNSSNALITHANSSFISEYDIQNFLPAGKYQVGNHPAGLAVSTDTIYGNQVFIANQADNNVSIYDTRFHNVVSVIPVAPNPTYVDISPDNTLAFVVSLGNGKLDPSQQKTAAKLTIINIKSKSIVSEKDIGTASQIYQADQQVPCALTVNGNNWVYVTTQNGLFRLNTKNLNVGMNPLQRGLFTDVVYNFRRDELVLTEVINNKNNFVTFDATSGSKLSTYPLPANVSLVYPIK